MNRRDFTKRIGSMFLFVAAGGTSLLISGCNVFSDILNWIPVGEAALSSIILVLSSNGVILPAKLQSVIELIRAGFDALSAAVKEYRSTTPAPVGAVAKIETALKDIVDNFSTFLSSLSVSSNLLGIIVGLSQIVLSTIAAFVNRLPPSMSVVPVRARIKSMSVGTTPIVVVAKDRSTGAFKKDFNVVLKTAPSEVKVPANAYL